jgi:TldD protein
VIWWPVPTAAWPPTSGPLVRCLGVVIVEENGKREQGGRRWRRFDFGYFDDVLQRYAKEAVHQAVVNLHAEPAPAGR